MDNFDAISDEQLASFLDGNTIEEENIAILNAVSTEQDMEVLSMAYSVKQFIVEDLEDMPEWDDTSLAQISPDTLEQLKMCGFLGDEPENVE